MGKVYLVGAGCGDLDLYTIKALWCIEHADCLVYDSLVDSEILEKCKKDCEMIFVGKRASHHAMEQNDINQLLVDKSKEHEIVVRLKGGDVYVFGRGGEEGELLSKNKVDFEVVPGVSSCTAGLAYAGIPITHRGLSGGFQVYTGALRQNQDRAFDFKTMLDDYCTYVFLMSMAKLEMITNGFLEAGKNPDTPVAVISNASLAIQKTLTGTLQTIVALFKENPLPTPGLIVVGNVVKMREYLNFFETKPLFSKNILVTSVGIDHYLKNELRSLGANVTEVVTGEIVYHDIDISLEPSCLVFTSKHGVISYMNSYFKQHKDLRKLAGFTIVSIGDKTSECLNSYGLCADYISSDSTGISLNEEIKNFNKENLPIVFIKGNLDSDFTNFNQAIVGYENKEVEINISNQHFDYAFFTAASSVERIKQNSSCTIDTFVSIGQKTSDAIALWYGDATIMQSKKANKKMMIDLILGGK